ncbi:MAG: hypothetical protein FWG30_11600 [Eubacteriaceae bacterium]|nr:hypothetical protein [Eubacteriaceae bacterium]
MLRDKECIAHAVAWDRDEKELIGMGEYREIAQACSQEYMDAEIDRFICCPYCGQAVDWNEAL